MSDDDRRYVSFEELLAYRQELDAKEAREEMSRRESEVESRVTEIDLDAIESSYNIRQLSRLFRALSNPIRLEIVELLIGRATTAGQIARELDEWPAHLSRHLATLMDAGLVSVEKFGATKVFSASERARKLMEAAGGPDAPAA